MKKFFAFTLAEVLITLGIIGVVAALTIPTLISKHQKKVYVTQLKKAVNTLSNGLKLIMADDGVDKLENTVFSKYLSYNTYNRPSEDIHVYMAKYFNTTKTDFVGVSSVSGYKGLNKASFSIPNVDSIVMYLADGAQIYLGSAGHTAMIPYVIIDVNGINRAPNTVGLDLFGMMVNVHGAITINGSLDYCNTSANVYSALTGCYAKVLEDNWEITYY